MSLQVNASVLLQSTIHNNTTQHNVVLLFLFYTHIFLSLYIYFSLFALRFLLALVCTANCFGLCTSMRRNQHNSPPKNINTKTNKHIQTTTFNTINQTTQTHTHKQKHYLFLPTCAFLRFAYGRRVRCSVGRRVGRRCGTRCRGNIPYTLFRTHR